MLGCVDVFVVVSRMTLGCVNVFLVVSSVTLGCVNVFLVVYSVMFGCFGNVFLVVYSVMLGWVGNLFVIVMSSVMSCLGCCFLNEDNCCFTNISSSSVKMMLDLEIFVFTDFTVWLLLALISALPSPRIFIFWEKNIFN